jgi:uncharacterized protein YhfF
VVIVAFLTIATPTSASTYTITAGGPTVTVTTTSPGENATLTFAGTAGQRISVKLSAVTISSSKVSILNPDGTTLAGPTYVGTSGGFLDTKTLAQTGTYTIFVDPQLAATGSMAVTLYNVPPDVTGTIVAGGAPATVTIATPGQNARLSFAGSAGQRISLKLSASTISLSKLSILNPDGTALVGSTTIGASGGFIDTRTLAQTGTYAIVLDPQQTATGSVTLTLYNVPPDATGAITPGGAPVTITVATPGQNALLTFGASAGQRISVKLGAVSGGTWKVSLKNPDGTTLVTPLAVGAAGAFIDTKTLAQTGTYAIVLDPQQAATGSMTVTLYNVPADVGGTIVAGGAPVTVTITTPGQNGRLSFSGSAGQRISLSVSGVTIGTSVGGTVVSILNPDGSQLATTKVGTRGGFIDTRTLAQTGTYTIVVDPQGAYTGSATLTLYNVPADVGGTIVAGGAPVTVTVTTPGQNARLSFAGSAGQRISLNVSGVTIGTLYSGTIISLLNPDQTTLVPATTVSTSGSFFEPRTLAQTGTYAIVVDPQGANTGSATLTLYSVPPDVTGTIAPGGTAVGVTITTPGQNASLSFAGSAGQRVSLKVDQSNCCGTNVSITNPDGTTLVPTTLLGIDGGFIDTRTLPQTGTYRILVDPRTTATGVVTLTLYNVPPDVTGTIAPGGAAVTLTTTTPGQNASATFTAAAGSSHTLTISASCCELRVSVLRPDGTVLAGPSSFGLQGGTLPFSAPVAGTYTIVVDPQATSTGSVTLALS